jgi:hypothetical protein
MGHPDFRVRDKIFATLHPDGVTASFKVAGPDLDALVASDPKTFRAVWGGRYLAVDLRRVKPAALRAIATDSWRLLAPKTVKTPTKTPRKKTTTESKKAPGKPTKMR